MSGASKNYLIDILDLLSEPDIDDSRWHQAVRLAQELGASALNMGAISVNDAVPTWFRSSMRGGFLEDYVAHDFVFSDPFVPHFKFSNKTLEFEAGGVGPGSTLSQGMIEHKQRLFDHSYSRIIGVPQEGSTKGMRRGINFCFDLDSDPTREDLAERMDRLRLLAAVLAAHVGSPASLDLPGVVFPREIVLTEREREVLSYLALGLKNDRIAERTGLAEVTVRKHMTAARKKLGAATREQALAIALKHGLIDI